MPDTQRSGVVLVSGRCIVASTIKAVFSEQYSFRGDGVLFEAVMSGMKFLRSIWVDLGGRLNLNDARSGPTLSV